MCGHLDTDGGIETARKGVDDAEVVDKRKVDQVVGELNRWYKVDVAALQETKRFGSVRLGRVLREDLLLVMGWQSRGGEGEGVAAVLLGVAVSAWKMLGSVGRHGVRGSSVSS